MGQSINFQKAKKQMQKQYDRKNEQRVIESDLEDSKKFVSALEVVVEYLKYFNISELVIDDDNAFLTEIDSHIIPGLAIESYNNKIIYLEINTENETITPMILTDDDFKQLDDDFEDFQDELNRLRNNDNNDDNGNDNGDNGNDNGDGDNDENE